MKILIIGAGGFGSTLAAELSGKKCEVVLIDNLPAALEVVKERVDHAIVGDATDKNLIAEFARGMDIAVVALGEKIDASVLVTHYLRECGIQRIIAKAASPDHGEILRIIGAAQIIYPEQDEARRLAASLISPDLLDLIRLSDDVNIAELAVPERFTGKTLAEVDLRRKHGLQLLAIRNALSGRLKVMPSPDTAFSGDDILYVIGDAEAVNKARS